jgi:FkbM family methyltransferase
LNIRYMKKLVNNIGFDIVRTNNYVKYPPARRMKIISACGIDLIFDVGANIGQYAQQMRRLGYRGRIVSFEPINSAYQELVKHASGDPGWETVNVALGSEDSESEINISDNSYSSSILDITSTHLRAMASAQYIGKQPITIRKMDSIFNQYFHPGNKLFIKLDTQGYEKYVIAGAENAMSKAVCLQVEMSLVPLFQGELLLADMVNLMFNKGFVLWSLEDEFNNPGTGQLLQVNGIFLHKNLM